MPFEKVYWLAIINSWSAKIYGYRIDVYICLCRKYNGYSYENRYGHKEKVHNNISRHGVR